MNSTEYLRFENIYGTFESRKMAVATPWATA